MLTFNVSAYGVSFGSGKAEAVQRANLLAIRDAIAAANAASASDDVEVVIDGAEVECYFDPALYAMSRDVGGTITTIGIIKPTANTFTFRGQSASSEITFFPDAPTFTYNMLYIDAALGRRVVTLSTLTLNGPPDFGVEDPTTDPDRYAIRHQGSTIPGAYASATLTLSGVTVTGECTGAFTTSSGDVAVRMLGCNMVGVIVAASVFNPGLCSKSLYILGGSYESSYLGPSDEGVTLYIHPNIAPGGDSYVMVDGADLTCHTRYCLYYNGTAGVASPAPAQIVIRNVTYTGGDFLQSSYVCPTEFYGCSGTVQADEGAICISRGPLDCHDNAFTGGQIQSADGPTGVGAHTYQHVYDNSYTDLASVVTHNFTAFSNGHVHDNAAVGVSASFSFFAPTIPTTGDEVIVEENTLTGTFGRGFMAVRDDTTGRVVLRRNTISGTSPFIYGIGSGSPIPDVDIVLEGNITDDNAIQLKDFPDNVVSGSGNLLRSSFPITFAGGATSKQSIQNREGTASDIAIGATINLDPSADTVHITGVGTLETMYIANDADQNACFLGRYTIVFDAAATVSAIGNIVPLIVGARTPGSFTSFTWDQDDELWRETRPAGIDPRILYSDGIIGRAMALPEFYDVLIGVLNELCAIFGVTEIDPQVLEPDAVTGHAMEILDFYDLLILTINELIDAGGAGDQIDPRVIYADSTSGEALSVLPFFDLVIFTVNTIIGAA